MKGKDNVEAIKYLFGKKYNNVVILEMVEVSQSSKSAPYAR